MSNKNKKQSAKNDISKKIAFNIGVISLSTVLGFSCISCAKQSTVEELEATLQENQIMALQLEHRVNSLEEQVEPLENQISTQEYEVLNSKGRKTGMTAIPKEKPKPLVIHVDTTKKENVSAQVPNRTPNNTATRPPSRNNTAPKSDKDKPVTLAQAPSAGASDLSMPPENISAPTQTTRNNLSVPKTPPTVTTPPSTANNKPSDAPKPSSAAVTPPPANAQRTSPNLATPPATPPTQNTLAPNASANNSLGMPPSSSAPVAPPTPANNAVTTAPMPTMTSTVPNTKPANDATSGSSKAEDPLYKEALKLVLNNKLDAGRVKLEQFLQQFPNGKYAPNAYYWIGETYYAQKKYPESLAAFSHVVNNYPKHQKASDSLLKAGMTYRRLGDVQKAGEQYAALRSKYPNSNAVKTLNGFKGK